jgi:isoleucyl-tRNA synthetase
MRTVDGMAAAAELAAGRPVVVPLEDGPVELDGDEVELRVKAQPGFAVSRDGAEVVALDLRLDDDLLLRGLAREVIRHVQDLRKATGLEVADWIQLHLVGLDDLRPMFESIAREVLARSVSTSPPEGAAPGTVLRLEAGDAVVEATAWVFKA